MQFQVSHLQQAISAASARGYGLAFFGDRVVLVPEKAVKVESLESYPLEQALAYDGGGLLSFANLGVRGATRG